MNRKAYWSHLVAGAGAILLLGLAIAQSVKLGDLRNALDQQDRNITDLSIQMNNISRDVGRLGDDLRQEVAAQGSLFTQMESTLAYADGLISLHVSVVPKELRQGETLVLSIDGGGSAPLTVSPNASHYSAVLSLSPAEAIYPTVSLVSDAGRRQEVLEPLFADSVFSLDVQSEFRSGRDQLYFLITPGPSLDPDFLKGAQITLSIQDETRTERGAPAAQPSPTTQEMTPGSAAFTADLTPYASLVGSFQVRLSVTAEHGLELQALNAIASFSNDGEGTSATSDGGDTLLPVWPENPPFSD